MWRHDQSDQTAASQQTRPGVATPSATGPAENVVMDLGTSVVIKGELSGSEDFTISGRMEGSIRLHGHTLTIGPHADINADIDASIVVIQGTVTGAVTATTKVEIQATGSVTGDIVSPRLAVAEGARVRGRVDTQATA